MTTKKFECWSCQFFQRLNPEVNTEGRCHRNCPHALDLYGFNATPGVLLPIGDDGTVLTADSTSENGVSWQTSGGDFVLQHEVGRLEQMQNNTYQLARNGLAPSSGVNFPVCNSNTIFDNSDILPFAVPENGEIVAFQMSITRAAVGVAAVGDNPYCRVEVLENYGSGEATIGTVDVPIDAAKVDVNNNLGTNDFYSVLHKLETPITFNPDRGLYGFQINLSDNTSAEQVSAIKNIVLTAYVRVPLTDISEEAAAEAAEAVADSVTPEESISKYAFVPDGSTFWCGDYKKQSGEVPPLP